MLVLIATNELQGTADGDYACTVDGELVTVVVTECASSDQCGCARGFPGLASGKATTTAMIVERSGVSRDDLRDAVYDWLDRGGWFDLVEQDDREFEEDLVQNMVDEHIEMIDNVCMSFPVGTVLGRSGSLVASRSMPTAA